MPVLQGIGTGVPAGLMAVIAADGSSLTLPNTSPWLIGDTVNDTAPINVGDIVLFKNAYGMAMQTVTSTDATHIYFAQNNANDWFHLNQRNPAFTGTIYCLKPPMAGSPAAPPTPPATCDPTTVPPTLPVPMPMQTENFGGDPANTGAGTAIMRLLMITYYVDGTTSPGTPRLTRVINHFSPQALAGVVEDLDFTYDLVDSSSDMVANRPTLPTTVNGVTYTSNMIKKVNIHMGVRSEALSKPTMSYVRNHINTAVGIRSLAAVDRYDTSQ
jgi:hypothetical protein